LARNLNRFCGPVPLPQRARASVFARPRAPAPRPRLTGWSASSGPAQAANRGPPKPRARTLRLGTA
jgi:hypothetical protein